MSQAAGTGKSDFRIVNLLDLACLGFPSDLRPVCLYLYQAQYSNVVVDSTHYWLGRHQNEMEVEVVIQNVTTVLEIQNYDAQPWATASGHGLPGLLCSWDCNTT